MVPPPQCNSLGLGGKMRKKGEEIRLKVGEKDQREEREGGNLEGLRRGERGKRREIEEGERGKIWA